MALQWRHKERNEVSNHQQLDDLFKYYFNEANIIENIKARVTGPLWGESTGSFPSQRVSNTENFPCRDVIMDSGNKTLSNNG